MDTSTSSPSSGQATGSSLSAMGETELAEAAQGCTELTCLYHGEVNEERRRRGYLRRG